MDSFSYKKQIIKYALYVLLVFGLTTLAIFLSIKDNYHNIIPIFLNVKVGYMLLIISFIVICILLRSIANNLIVHTYLKKYSFHRSIAIDQIGTLYKMVTPAGLGGNVMEVYTYKKQGIPLSIGLSVIAMYSIVYQISLIIYNLLTIIIKRNLISEIGNVALSFGNYSSINIPLWLLVTIGFILNIVVIGIIYLLSFSKRVFSFISGPFGKCLFKLKLIRDVNIYRDKLDNTASNFRKNLKQLFTHWKILIITFVVLSIYITISYSIPYFVGKALGENNSSSTFFDSVLLSNFHQMVTSIVPIPGYSLSSEMFFLKLFYPLNGPKFYSSEEIAKAALLLWRTSMFIFPIIISFIYTLCYRPRAVCSKEDILCN